MSITKWTMALICTGGLLTAQPAAADANYDKLSARMQQLEQAVRDLQDSMRQQGAEVAEKMAAVDQVRADWNGYQGTVDSISQQQQLLLDQLRKYIDEFDGRLRSVEGKVGAKKSADATDSTTSGDTDLAVAPSAAPGNALQAIYQDGLNAVQARDYDKATATFQKVINTQPNGKLALDAQYWLGECRFALKQYPQAVKDYQIVVDRAPGTDKAVNALYKQGEAKLALGLADEGKRLLQQVVIKAPNSKVAQRATNHLNSLVGATAERNR